MSHEIYRWIIFDHCVQAFNDHRELLFVLSHFICVEEGVSIFYGQCGHWIHMELPMCIAIDQNPENGCEIQNSACGRSGVMLRLRLVKTAE